MKKLILLITTLLISLSIQAQTKRDGTPDMRYKANKEMYGNGYNQPTYKSSDYKAPSYNYNPNNSNSKQRNYPNGGQLKIQQGYQKQNGRYVSPHIKTTPDNKKWNNWKSK